MNAMNAPGWTNIFLRPVRSRSSDSSEPPSIQPRMFTAQTMSVTMSAMTMTAARMPGPRWLIQSVASEAMTFFVSAFTRVRLLYPQLLHTTALGGSSAFAQCGQRATSSSRTTPSGFGATPCGRFSSSSSSRKGLLGFSSTFGSGLGGGAGALAAGFAGAALGAALAFGTTMGNTSWQSLHLIFLPSSSVGTFNFFPQLGQETSSVAAMVEPFRQIARHVWRGRIDTTRHKWRAK